MVAFLLFTIQGFLEPQFRPTFVLVQNNNLKREMEQFIIILCYTTYKIMRSHFKVISVLCYFPSDRYFMYFLMKFFFRSFLAFVLLRIQHQLFEYVLSKKPDFCISLGKKFFGHNCPERFSCFWHLYKFCHKNSKIFLGTISLPKWNAVCNMYCYNTQDSNTCNVL